MPVYRSELKSGAARYANAVRDHELSVFTNYIVWIVENMAYKGALIYEHPVLPKHQHITRTTIRGILDKNDPGAVQHDYVDDLIHRLRTHFPDTDIHYVDERTDSHGRQHGAVIRLSWA